MLGNIFRETQGLYVIGRDSLHCICRDFTVNNIHEKLLDSDWLRAVQFKCNTSAKSVRPVQITHPNSGL